jgi:hypothetical protein
MVQLSVQFSVYISTTHGSSSTAVSSPLACVARPRSTIMTSAHAQRVDAPIPRHPSPRAPGRASGSPVRSLLPQHGTPTTRFKARAGASVRRAPHKTSYNTNQRSLHRRVGLVGARISMGSGDPATSFLPQHGTRKILISGPVCSRSSAPCCAPHTTRHNPQHSSLHRGVGPVGAQTWAGKQRSAERASSAPFKIRGPKKSLMNF